MRKSNRRLDGSTAPHERVRPWTFGGPAGAAAGALAAAVSAGAMGVGIQRLMHCARFLRSGGRMAVSEPGLRVWWLCSEPASQDTQV